MAGYRVRFGFSGGERIRRPKLKVEACETAEGGERCIPLIAILFGMGLFSSAASTQPLTAPLPAHNGTRVVTPELALELSASQHTDVEPGLAWLGDSDRLIFARFDPQLKRIMIESLDATSGRRTKISDGAHPEVSPDGLWLAYQRIGATNTVLCLMRMTDRKTLEIARFVDQEFSNLIYAWSPDSRQIAVGWQTPFAQSSQGEAGDDQLRTTAVDLDAQVNQSGSSQIKVYDLRGTPPLELLKTTGALYDVDWYPDGDNVLYTVVHFGGENSGGESSTVLGQANLVTGRDTPVLRLNGARQRLAAAISPGGHQIAMTFDVANAPYDLLESVALIRSGAAVGNVRPLTHDMKMHGAAWYDEKSLLARRRFGAYSQLYHIDANSGAMTQLTNVGADVIATAIGMRGRIAVITMNAQSMMAISVGNLRANALKLRRVAELVRPPANLRLAEVREIAWEYTDGILSRGLVFLPDYSDKQRHPLVVDLHGGLVGASLRVSGGALLYNTPLEFHMWAAKGYVVLVPEFRSSGALGHQALQKMRDTKDAYGFHGDEKDIMAGIDRLVDLGVADPDRVAILGFSGGAAEVNWLVSRTRNRFRAAVSCDGFAETYFITTMGASIGGDPAFSKRIGGWPWEIVDVYLKNSATYYASGATTPTLFLMGEPDISGVDPSLSSQFLYTALKRQGVDTRYVQYAQEGHGLIRPANRRDSLRRAVEWIDRHMSGVKSSSVSQALQ